MEDVLALAAFTASLYLLGKAFELLRLPALLGELAAGVVLGPHGVGLLSSSMVSSLKVAGQVGLLLMVLEGGLSMEVSVLRQQGVRAVVLALTGTVLPVLLGWATMAALGADDLASVAAGTALSSTAIGFTLRLMTDLKLLETKQGQLITAAAMLDDVFSLVLLAMLKSLQPDEEGDLDVDAWLLIRPLVASGGVFVAGLLYAALTGRADAALRSSSSGGASSDGEGGADAGAFTASKRLRGRIRDWLRSPAVTLATMLGGGVLLSWAADAAYSSSLLGAFCAGTAFCFLPHARDSWAASVAPLQAWLSRLFFGATVAFEVPLGALVRAEAVGDGMAMTVAAIVGKFLSGAWAAPLFSRSGGGGVGGGGGGGGCGGRAFWVAWLQVGCAMIGRGELGFVLATESLDAEMLDQRQYCATVWALLLATLLGPCAFRLSLLVPSTPPPSPAAALSTRASSTTATEAVVVGCSPSPSLTASGVSTV